MTPIRYFTGPKTTPSKYTAPCSVCGDAVCALYGHERHIIFCNDCVPPDTFRWMHRPEGLGENWVIAGCLRFHHEALLGLGFVDGPGDHELGRRLGDHGPTGCAVCGDDSFLEDAAACSCVAASALCTVHLSNRERLCHRDIGTHAYGDYPWDHWEKRALQARVSPTLAALGRGVMREAYQHGWGPGLYERCGWTECSAAAMITLAQKDKKGTRALWAYLLDSDGLRGRRITLPAPKGRSGSDSADSDGPRFIEMSEIAGRHLDTGYKSLKKILDRDKQIVAFLVENIPAQLPGAN